MRTMAMIAAVIGVSLAAGQGPAASGDAPIAFLDQGATWTPALRAAFYTQDQGSQLIPLRWLRALRQDDGTAFLAGSLGRYGYLPNATSSELPIGFTVAASAVGMTCAACHTRQITVAERSYRIDGGPAFADFGTFIEDLDRAVLRVLADGAAFGRFAKAVDGNSPGGADAGRLHAGVALWSLRFHALVGGSVPHGRRWGPARVDAMGMIFNELTGLDLGPAPAYLIPGNIVVADAPTRYPFLWNVQRQDRTQWSGIAANGNAGLALARNVGEVLGVFAEFHPGPKTMATPLDRDYLTSTSVDIAGLAAAEAESAQIGPPVWPFPRDAALAGAGRAVFDRSTARGGCIDCHGATAGEPRPPSPATWKTPLQDVGTDTRQWSILLRTARTGVLEGASVPGVTEPLRRTDLALSILKTAAAGSLVQFLAASAPSRSAVAQGSAPIPKATMEDLGMAMNVDAMGSANGTEPAARAPVYEARVLQGVWAAAPYLHNGSIASLRELLLPSGDRRKSFAVGPAYDIDAVGLAETQPGSPFILKTTGCEDRASGDSNCGHEYGTGLPPEDKRALLEYLKTL